MFVCRGEKTTNEIERIAVGNMERLPLLAREVMESWDLGDDGKGYLHLEPTDEYYLKLMRK